MSLLVRNLQPSKRWGMELDRVVVEPAGSCCWAFVVAVGTPLYQDSCDAFFLDDGVKRLT